MVALFVYYEKTASSNKKGEESLASKWVLE